MEFADREIENITRSLTDLEASPNGQVKIVVAPAKRLALDWGDDRFVLDQSAMAEVMVMVGFLMQEHKKLSKALQGYSFRADFVLARTGSRLDL